MFRDSDSHTYVVDPDEDPDFESQYQVPSRSDVLSRLHKSFEQFEKIFKDAASYCEQWSGLLTAAEFRCIMAGISEILEMSPLDSWRQLFVFSLPRMIWLNGRPDSYWQA